MPEPKLSPLAPAGDGALSVVPVDASDAATRDKTPRKPYWIGSMPRIPRGEKGRNPVWNYTARNVVFSRYRGEFQFDEQGDVVGNPELGVVVRLTDDDAKAMLEDIAKGFVRNLGVDPSVVKTTDKYFEPRESDIPLGRFLYVYALGAESAPKRDAVPRPLVAWPEEAASELKAAA